MSEFSPITFAIFFFKSFIEFVTILLLVYVFWWRGLWELSSLTRDGTHTPCIGRQSPDRWTAREALSLFLVS